MSLNYTDWKNDNKSILETFPDKKVLMLFTGGKDSSVILTFLLAAGKEFGFEFETNSAMYPNSVFDDSEVEKLDKYWLSRNVNIKWHDVGSSDSLLAEALRDGKNPCGTCQKIKRSYLFKYLKEVEQKNKEIVVILSFTLWDLVSYSIEHLVSGIYTSNYDNKSYSDKSLEERFTQTSQRFYPLIESKDGLTIFKPLLKYNNHEILEIISKENIPLSNVECEYKNFTPKRRLFDYYNQINASFDYDNVLNHARDSLKLNELSDYTELAKDDLIKMI